MYLVNLTQLTYDLTWAAQTEGIANLLEHQKIANLFSRLFWSDQSPSARQGPGASPVNLFSSSPWLFREISYSV